MRDALGYRALMGVPERILISSFYQAQPAYPGVRIVGPMLRDEVLRAKPTQGDYLLCYFNKGEHQYRPHIDRALRLLDCPVVIYATPYRGKVENLDFRAPSNEWFVHDLAGCKAVLSTAGNQTIGESIHFGKPILAMPEEAFEQRLNAHLIERMGVGMRGDLARLNPSDVDRFLGHYERYRSFMREHARDGRAEAIETLHRFIAELVQQKAPTRRRGGGLGAGAGAGAAQLRRATRPRRLSSEGRRCGVRARGFRRRRADRSGRPGRPLQSGPRQPVAPADDRRGGGFLAPSA